MSDIIIPPIVPNRTTLLSINVDDRLVELDLTELFTTKDVYVNVTPVFKEFDAKPAEFFRSKRWKKLEAGFQSRYGKSAYRTESGGSQAGGGGTWVHAWIAPRILDHLSVDFALAVDELLRSVVAQEGARLARREVLRVEHFVYTDAVRDYFLRNEDRPPTKPEYRAWAEAANNGATGLFSWEIRSRSLVTKTREGMTEGESSDYQKILDNGKLLLEMDLPYQTVLEKMREGV